MKYLKGLLLILVLLLIGGVGYGAYEFTTFENLKHVCISQAEEKAKIIKVHFDSGTNENLMPVVAIQLRDMDNVASVLTISSEEALLDFKERHANDALMLQALKQLGTNPLGPSIEITFQDIEILIATEGAVLAEIEARASAQGLQPNNIISKTRSLSTVKDRIERTPFLVLVITGSYVDEKEVLKGCVAQTTLI